MRTQITFKDEKEYDKFLRTYTWDEKPTIISNTTERDGTFTIKGNEKLIIKYEEYKNI